jgi:DNA-directed RNA polymerase omega subunit
MINEPNVDTMTRKLGAQDDPVSSYVLCVVASKRARQIIEQEHNKGNIALPENGEKEIVTACKEIADGKVGYSKD